jgi:hypothetical protein
MAKRRRNYGAAAAKFVPTQDQRAAVEVMAGFGIAHEEIRRAVIHPDTGRPITAKTLRAYFNDELKNGRSKVKLQVAATLLARAKTDKSGACAIFMGKTVLGLRDVNTHEIGGIPGGAAINIQDLTDAQLDQFIAVLEKRLASSGGPQGGTPETR